MRAHEKMNGRLLFQTLNVRDDIVEIRAGHTRHRLHFALPFRYYLLHGGGALAERLRFADYLRSECPVPAETHEP
jgi:hypothetical protein